ncbi:unnamed protein product [Soboliphyme baturini]|uniref:Protein-lysine N-methyltransferase SBAD_LOCUS4037 n=1 Tax=Soboliphyme baturini TaxID=241478 RepID=A0A183IK91_9BILA|nr:unnamed protein product [Soboliphyme baturini]
MSGDVFSELSDQSLTALLEFYAEAEQSRTFGFEEDWQLSQFWYDDRTAEILAKECLQQCVDQKGVIGCICSPTVFIKLKETFCCDSVKFILFEFDRRFAKYGSEFVFYDCNGSLDELSNFQNTCDVVIADPPFLSKNCMRNIFQAIQLITRGKFIICTGVVLEEFILEHDNVHRCVFAPSHKNKLCNEFRCYANYVTSYLDSDVSENE